MFDPFFSPTKSVGKKGRKKKRGKRHGGPKIEFEIPPLVKRLFQVGFLSNRAPS